MPIYLLDGSPLLDGGDIAIAEACCCGAACVNFPYGCTDYFTASTRGVAGTQPDVNVTISGVTSKSSNPNCSTSCSGCGAFFNATFANAPCETTSHTEFDAIACNGWGLLSGIPAPLIRGEVYVFYDIEIHGTETVAFVWVQVIEGGAATCEGSQFIEYLEWIQIYHLAVSNPSTWRYPATCGDDTKWTSYPGLLSGTFTAGLGGYTPARSWGYGAGGPQSPSNPGSCDYSSISVSVATA